MDLPQPKQVFYECVQHHQRSKSNNILCEVQIVSFPSVLKSGLVLTWFSTYNFDNQARLIRQDPDSVPMLLVESYKSVDDTSNVCVISNG